MRKAVPELRVQPEAKLQIYMKKGEEQQQRGLEESLQFHWRPAEIAVNAIIFKLVLAAKRRDPNAKAGGRGAGRGTVRIASMSRLCPDWARSRSHWDFLSSSNPASSPGQFCPGEKERPKGVCHR